MKKVKMLKSIRGKVNGEPMGPYSAGQVYELDDQRALLFAESAIAELVSDTLPSDAMLPAVAEAPGVLCEADHDGDTSHE